MATSIGGSNSADEGSLKHQLTVARNEINNLRVIAYGRINAEIVQLFVGVCTTPFLFVDSPLEITEEEKTKKLFRGRQQLRSLQHVHEKDISNIRRVLESWQNAGSSHAILPIPKIFTPSVPDETCKRVGSIMTEDGDIIMKPIGYVSTWFPEKRGTPRQPGVSGGAQGKITLSTVLFTNPEHALEGLEEFSHMWILFYFHKNDSSHIKAKVSPPRLNGMRTGVFGTRSPHRPCPIGLSLVQIDRVEGGTVFFSGVDMVDQTPVLDLKPFIPQYDDPLHCEPALMSVDLEYRLTVDGQESDEEVTPVQPARSPARDAALIGQREAPDGEEGEPPALLAPVAGSPIGQSHAAPLVRVPRWITRPLVQPLEVIFSPRAEAQLAAIKRDHTAETKSAIESVLHEDPRSAYLRQNWSNQFYTFLIAGLHVSCRFDDSAHTVSVFRINVAGKLCECGTLEWQCEQHGGTE